MYKKERPLLRHSGFLAYILMSKYCYITTTIPYVNADPHIGFALEIVHADIFTRYQKLLGYEIFFNTGTDEHGIKVWRKATELGKDPQQYVDESALKYKALLPALGISGDVNFIRTTNPAHKRAAQEFWRRCETAGDIYKKNYKVKYCVGCELEKTDSELENGRCGIHPNLELEIIEEENYFFRLSNYQEKLLKLYDSRADFVVPGFRLNEIYSLIKEKGLEDFSISRLKEKMPWGVAVPGDDRHVMYVWFDAFINYISAIGWPDDMENFTKWWPVLQFAGKDQVRQQVVMWQAMLMSVGIPPSRQIIIHGFITSGGEKMSKSLGNVVDPVAIIAEFGTDALRWYLARHIHPFEDSDFTLEKFKEAYNADLANGIGNLVSRIMKMAQEHISDTNIPRDTNETNHMNDVPQIYREAFLQYNIQGVAECVMQEVSRLDRRIQETEPFKLVKKDREQGVTLIKELVTGLSAVARMLTPILPETAKKIEGLVRTNEMPVAPLFPRK